MSSTSRYAFLTSGRWLGLIAAMVVVSVVCALLGVWQWGRYEVRAAQAAQVDAVYDAAPVPLTDALDGRPVVGADAEWRPVTLTGRYAEDSTVLLRNRPVDGTAAVHVVAPFLAELPAGGRLVVVVDRGWTGAAAAEAGDVPAPPDGDVALVGRLRMPEARGDRTAPAGQVYTLDAGEVLGSGGVAGIDGLPVLDGYVAAVSEQPPAEPLGGFGRPDSRYGVNLSYAFQWWFFSAGALVALVVLARREAAEESGTQAPRRRRTAEMEEDAVVDAQLGLTGGTGEARTSVPDPR